MDYKIIVSIVIGIIIGVIVYDRFFVPELQTKIEIRETFKTDTVYRVIRDTVKITNVQYIYERDTIVENYTPKIRGFKETFITKHGNAYLTGEVLGDLRYASLTTDFKYPFVTNTVSAEKTSKIIIEPAGLFLTGGINNIFSYSIGTTYLKNKSLIGYEYNINQNIHSLKVGFKIL